MANISWNEVSTIRAEYSYVIDIRPRIRKKGTCQVITAHQSPPRNPHWSTWPFPRVPWTDPNCLDSNQV